MNFELIVEPGAGIGPVKLGMTREEVQTLGVDLSDDLFRTRFDDNGRCNQIEVFVFGNKRPVLLKGRDLNKISRKATEDIFLALYGSNHTDRDDLGIRCLEWELSDPYFTFIEVAPSKVPRLAANE